MPRKPRIEYHGAFYHVMNRGQNHQTIFHGRDYYCLFTETIEDAYERFGAIVHAYCLMGNHYHLLLETPNANLSRIMRHINGVYTQRHNVLRKKDGPLFKGRFKALLVDSDSYLLELSRYVHRNPVKTRNPLVTQLEDYLWSSYPAYIGKEAVPCWLETKLIYKMLGSKNHQEGYSQFMDNPDKEDLLKFYSKGNYAPIIGSDSFRAWVYDELLTDLDLEQKVSLVVGEKSLDEIVLLTARFFNLNPQELKASRRNSSKTSLARKVAMYLSQRIGGFYLNEIASYFDLSHSGSVSNATHQIRKRKILEPEFNKIIEKIINTIVKNAT